MMTGGSGWHTGVMFVWLTGILYACAGQENPRDEAAQMLVDPVPAEQIPKAPVLEPAAARADLQVEEGFEVQLVAAEPHIHDPVALTFDGNGAMWVVEMRGYMPDITGEGEEEAVGRIVVLRDQDGDGYYEQVIPFLEGLVMPRAIAMVDGGILVAEPPNLYFVENHDYQAGEKVLIDSTYAVGGNVEHQPNGLLWAMDNWIYSAKSDQRYRHLNGQWVRDTTEYRGQWGISQDDYGRLFYNVNHLVLLGDRFMPSTFPSHTHHPATSPGRFGISLSSNRVYPRRMTPGVNRGYRDGELDDEGRLVHATSTCGPVIYRGDNFPPAYYGNAFIPEPAAHLMKRVVLADSAGMVTGRPAYTGREFLTATDERFRPVNAYTAPDGSLYVVDMYRGIIQHKTYLTPYLQRQIEQRGLDTPIGLGRIYRIKHTDTPLGPAPRLLDATTEDLVGYLTHPNGWWRDTAQRLLIQRKDTAALAPLRELAANPTHPVAQLHALWTLEGLQALRLTDLQQAARGTDQHLQATIIHLAARWATTSEARTAFDLIHTLRTSPFLDLHTALVLAPFYPQHPDATMSHLASLTAQYGDQPLYRDALLGGLENKEEAFTQYLTAHKHNVPVSFTTVLANAQRNATAPPRPVNRTLSAWQERQFAMGQGLYITYCMACHGREGEGLETMAPPLDGTTWVTGDPETLVRLVLDGREGPIEVNGTTYAPPRILPAMPGLRDTPELTDQNLAALLTYIRNAWSNTAAPISAGEISRIRHQHDEKP